MEVIRENTCCFTGHRILPKAERQALCVRLREEISRMAKKGIDTFLAGGALGFDTLAAQTVLGLRGEELPQLRLVLVLPCRDQERLWNERDQQLYHDLLRQADEVIYTGDLYSRECMFVRNRYLVDHSSHCLCYLTRDRGGTAYTVRYAEKQGLEMINLAE